MVYQSDSRVWSCLRFWYLRWAHTHTYVKNMSGCEIAVVRTHQAACELQLGAGTDSHSDLNVLKCNWTDISWTCLDLFTLSEWFTHPRTSIYSIVQSLCSCELPSGYTMPCSFNVCVCVFLFQKPRYHCLWLSIFCTRICLCKCVVFNKTPKR